MVVAVGISLLSCIRAEMHLISYLLPVKAAIFDLRHTQTKNSIPSSLSLLPDPKNMGVAVEISLLSFIRAETHLISYLLRLMAAIFDLRRTHSSNSIIIFNCVFYGTENVLLPLKLCCYHVYLLRYL